MSQPNGLTRKELADMIMATKRKIERKRKELWWLEKALVEMQIISKVVEPVGNFVMLPSGVYRFKKEKP